MFLNRYAHFLSFWLFLAGCAGSHENSRPRLVAPREIGIVYSEVETQARLAIAPTETCHYFDCQMPAAFRQRVLKLGHQLEPAAYKLALEMNLTPPRFDIVVPGKNDIGSLSTAAGGIILFDGLRQFDFDDPALAFLIAREMGHILAQHHEENSATSLSISVAFALLFPVAQMMRSAEAAYAAAASTTSLASSAASFAGATIVKGIYRSDQQQEADILALRILAHGGWSSFEVAQALELSMPLLGHEGWMGELQLTKRWVDRMTFGPLPLLAGADVYPVIAEVLTGVSMPDGALSELPSRLIDQNPSELAVETPSATPLPVFQLQQGASVPDKTMSRALQRVPSVEKQNVTQKSALACVVRVVRGERKRFCKAATTSRPPPAVMRKSAPAKHLR